MSVIKCNNNNVVDVNRDIYLDDDDKNEVSDSDYNSNDHNNQDL